MLASKISDEQREAVDKVSRQLNVLWEKTAMKERAFRVNALKMFVSNLAAGKDSWAVSDEERELGAYLVETPISQWLTLYIDNDGVEHATVYSVPSAWQMKEAPPAPSKKAKEEPVEDEMSALLSDVRKK